MSIWSTCLSEAVALSKLRLVTLVTAETKAVVDVVTATAVVT